MTIKRKIALLAFIWLILVNPGSITNFDTERRLQMAHAWWTGTEENLPGNEVVININDKNYIPYDLGQSMLMLPGDWLGEKLGQNFGIKAERQYFREAIVSFLIFVPLNLLTVLTCFQFLQTLGYSEKVAGLSSLVWLLGTSVLFYSTFHQQNNQILLFVLLGYQAALTYVIKRKKSLAILSGVSLGIAFLIRVTSILYAVGVLTFIVGCAFKKHRLESDIPRIFNSASKAFGLWVMGFVPFIVLERILTYIRYGEWTANSASLHLQAYARASGLSNSNNVVEGTNTGLSFLKLLTKVKSDALLAPFFSPEKSVFLYDPLMLPCLIALIVCWKFLSPYIKYYVITVVIGFLLHTYIYSWTSNWITDGVWGARYQITSIHLLLVPLIPFLVKSAIDQSKKAKSLTQLFLRWIAKIAIAVAVAVQLSSISLHFSLEATQQSLGFGSRFHMVQRFDNILFKIKSTDLNGLKISKVSDRKTKTELEEKMTWDFMPFLYQNEFNSNSSMNNFIIILFIAWGILFISATIATTIVFLR